MAELLPHYIRKGGVSHDRLQPALEHLKVKRNQPVPAEDLSLNVSGMGEGSHQVQPTLNRELDSAYDLLGISSCTVTVAKEQESATETEPETTEKETTKASETAAESSREAETEGETAASATRHAVIVPPETTEARQATGLQTIFRK